MIEDVRHWLSGDARITRRVQRLPELIDRYEEGEEDLAEMAAKAADIEEMSDYDGFFSEEGLEGIQITKDYLDTLSEIDTEAASEVETQEEAYDIIREAFDDVESYLDATEEVCEKGRHTINDTFGILYGAIRLEEYAENDGSEEDEESTTERMKRKARTLLQTGALTAGYGLTSFVANRISRNNEKIREEYETYRAEAADEKTG